MLRGLPSFLQTRLKTLVEPNLKRSLENRVDRLVRVGLIADVEVRGDSEIRS